MWSVCTGAHSHACTHTAHALTLVHAHVCAPTCAHPHTCTREPVHTPLHACTRTCARAAAHAAAHAAACPPAGRMRTDSTELPNTNACGLGLHLRPPSRVWSDTSCREHARRLTDHRRAGADTRVKRHTQPQQPATLGPLQPGSQPCGAGQEGQPGTATNFLLEKLPIRILMWNHLQRKRK